jgi:isocitrate dehydrogenase (NAD+)
MHLITLIPGEGIGPEITTEARRIVDESGAGIEWIVADVGKAVEGKYGSPLPGHVLESVAHTGIAYKGPITTPFGGGYRVKIDWKNPALDSESARSYPSISVALRKEMDLYANVRPVKNIAGIKSRYEKVDLVFFRENTEDLYSGIEHMVSEDIAESIKIISKKASERIARAGFEYAKKNGRKRITIVHKANIMKLSDGLFLRTVSAVGKGYPGIEVEDRVVDNMCMQLVQKPEMYDVLILPNLYGDLLSDLGAGLVGGLGVAPGANIGERCCVFEAVHGSAPKYTGQNRANPTATILSMVMMLNHIGEVEKASVIDRALREVLREGKMVTADLGGNAGTREMAKEILRKMR